LRLASTRIVSNIHMPLGRVSHLLYVWCNLNKVPPVLTLAPEVKRLLTISMAQFRNNGLNRLVDRFFFESKSKRRGKSQAKNQGKKRPRSDSDLEPKTYQFWDPKESSNQEHNFAKAEELTNPLNYLFINAVKNVSLFIFIAVVVKSTIFRVFLSTSATKFFGWL
jgi:hypothetical protein